MGAVGGAVGGEAAACALLMGDPDAGLGLLWVLDAAAALPVYSGDPKIGLWLRSESS